MEITPPETEEALTLPFTFAYDGDDQQMPLTYFIGIPVTPHGFNWLLWVGAPSVVVALAVAGYAGRRLNVVPAPPLGRRRAAPEVAPSPDDLRRRCAGTRRGSARRDPRGGHAGSRLREARSRPAGRLGP